ncbi:hypothetical protein HG535_0C06270 [Zygotorulaspora mrakii]|uniref:Cytochrome b-c1 complex subunit 2, mitochondrial n=1 Tax=Zygotorulaspora mrakii TaxID=42260 RepID=A0A7H9B3E1_ZYGMR|nr:uncharacterized protein HG535_0C06270 [Zygotorulaspora mrakii]QLG72272.1 hypothetical protein HG535_0C06270 [Zygotorulaspora mrakii]
MLSSTTRVQFAKQALRHYTVTASDGTGKISNLAVKVHAGSRYATKDGISHLLSRFNFHNTSGKSALRLVRESELLGGKFESKVDREFITLSATFLKEDLPYFVNALGNVLYKTSFRPHELHESVLPAAHHDLLVHQTCPVSSARDLLYNATFRSGLGNPVLYDSVEKISIEDIKSFADKVYTKENIEIIGKGVNESDLKRFVNDSLLNSLPSGTPLSTSAAPKTFTGQQSRIRFEGQSVAAISVPVAKESFAEYQVLSNYVTSPVFELSSLIKSSKFEKFGDVGIFSLFVKGSDAKKVSEDFKKVISELKKGKDISVAKDLTALNFAIANETSSPLPELKLDSVKNFKLGKFNYVAVGDVSNLPYAEEL